MPGLKRPSCKIRLVKSLRRFYLRAARLVILIGRCLQRSEGKGGREVAAGALQEGGMHYVKPYCTLQQMFLPSDGQLSMHRHTTASSRVLPPVCCPDYLCLKLTQTTCGLSQSLSASLHQPSIPSTPHANEPPASSCLHSFAQVEGLTPLFRISACYSFFLRSLPVGQYLAAIKRRRGRKKDLQVSLTYIPSVCLFEGKANCYASKVQR